MLGSSLLLTSHSYIDIYQAVVDNAVTSAPQIDSDSIDEELFENPEYIDTLEGRLPLAEAAKMIAQEPKKREMLFDEVHVKRIKRDSYKRVIALGIALFFLYSSFSSIRNAQGSLMEDKKLSLLSYGAVNSLLWFGGVCANPATYLMKPKWAMVLASLGFLVFSVSQYHQAYYTLLPAAAICSLTNGMLWSLEGIYVMNTASTYALVTGEELVQVVGKLNGVVISCALGSNILGNLMGPFILGNLYTLPSERDAMVTNTSLSDSISNTGSTAPDCGIDFFENPVPASTTIYQGKQYLFFGVNTFQALIGLVVITVFVKKLKV